MIENKRGRICASPAIAGAFAMLLGVCALGTPALAQTEQPAEAGQQVEAQWAKRCSERDGVRACEISYGQYVDIRGSKLWISAAGIFERGDTRRLFIYTPPGSALREGIAFRIDTSEPKTAEYFTCTQIKGCQAVVEIDANMIQQLKAGGELQAQWLMVNRQPGGRSITLSGFTAAYDGEPVEIITADESGGSEGDAGAAAATGGKGDAAVQ